MLCHLFSRSITTDGAWWRVEHTEKAVSLHKRRVQYIQQYQESQICRSNQEQTTHNYLMYMIVNAGGQRLSKHDVRSVNDESKHLWDDSRRRRRSQLCIMWGNCGVHDHCNETDYMKSSVIEHVVDDWFRRVSRYSNRRHVVCDYEELRSSYQPSGTIQHWYLDNLIDTCSCIFVPSSKWVWARLSCLPYLRSACHSESN